ncbi:tRNA(Met) cytidine acetyltransferase TmcA [Motiliproteus sp. MSK22-1]|uniref:tRNA(Met) cytidine acetyltransferase TmcA n=1 Tax=Motiliproteus sp. MSK22-1 TaxID=1897630 RepID=UPI000977C31D|nr:GNAT family N-acetyltransferase [Motiliproteus sp. MSK22-1]OMH25267.1 hypothetical protein BGP75_26065 [Motiliproteus sp. MSK22-1]
MNLNRSFRQLVVDVTDQLLLRKHRSVLVLAGRSDWCRESAQEVLSIVLSGNSRACALWVGKNPVAGSRAVTAKQSVHLLGTESHVLFIDTYDGFNPDVMAALSGTLVAGSLLVLMTPPLDQWSGKLDLDFQRTLVELPKTDHAENEPAGETLNRSAFISLVSESIRTNPDILVVDQGEPIPPFYPTVSDRPDHPIEVPESANGGCQLDMSDCCTSDQAMAVEAIVHVVTGHRRRPLVITADRGRGKSSALGIAAARLLKAHQDRLGPGVIIVTAPRFSAVEGVFDIAESLLSGNRIKSMELQFANGVLRFIPPDEIIRSRPKADLVLVDEAAAIPAPMLQVLLEHYSRIAFSTTVHGYEGTGRGFQIRFKQTLQRLAPGWRLQTLKEPVRWADNDPLEHWVFNALLLNAEIAPDDQLSAINTETCSIELMNSEQLLEQRSTLKQVFALLVQAHYRTTPGDLRDLLDGRNLSVQVMKQGSVVVATMLVAQEGGFDNDMAEAIWSGRRRPRGHLLPQIMAAQAGCIDAPKLRYLRVVRIAVHPSLQGLGVGSRMLAHLMETATANRIDMVGSSFGATVDLLQFWRSNDYRILRLGLTKDASSGCYSALVAQPISVDAQILITGICQRFRYQLVEQLREFWKQLDMALVVELLKEPGDFGCSVINEQGQLDLLAFAYGHRGYEQALPSLRQLTLIMLADKALYERHEHADVELLIAKILQNQHWSECGQATGLVGRKPLEQRLRAIFASGLDTLELVGRAVELHSRLSA